MAKSNTVLLGFAVVTAVALGCVWRDIVTAIAVIYYWGLYGLPE
jgi:hypothetical protein